MSQLERLQNLCEELSEEIHAARAILKQAQEVSVREDRMYAYGYMLSAVQIALESLDRAQRLAGPFEPEHLPRAGDPEDFTYSYEEQMSNATDDDYERLSQR